MYVVYVESDGEFMCYWFMMELWFVLLKLCCNCFYFVDFDVEGICECVFGDYLEVYWCYEFVELL